MDSRIECAACGAEFGAGPDGDSCSTCGAGPLCDDCWARAGAKCGAACAAAQRGGWAHPARAAYGSTPVKMLLRLSEDMDRALRAAAVREGVSTSEYVRRAVAAALGG